MRPFQICSFLVLLLLSVVEGKRRFLRKSRWESLQESGDSPDYMRDDDADVDRGDGNEDGNDAAVGQRIVLRVSSSSTYEKSQERRLQILPPKDSSEDLDDYNYYVDDDEFW